MQGNDSAGRELPALHYDHDRKSYSRPTYEKNARISIQVRTYWGINIYIIIDMLRCLMRKR